jgi:glycosyltransferase involved in cell wall biosynthesis
MNATEMEKVSATASRAEQASRKTLDGVEWLTWQSHRRTENIASYYGIPVTVITSKARGLRRYLQASLQTLRYLYRNRPRVLIVQNPSLVLTLLAVLLRPLLCYRLVVDAHNEAVQPFIHTSAQMVSLSRWLLRKADITIVTNQALAGIVQSAGGVAVVLPDRLPDIRLSMAGEPLLAKKTRAVLIATFARDEPIAEVLEAHAHVREDVDLYVTGRLANLPVDIREKYREFVGFTDFLPEGEYEKLLEEADFIVDLTLMDNCLVCGAYEAIALGKPAILSDNRATRDYFYKGVVYVDNTVDGLVNGMRNMLADRRRLTAQALSLKAELTDAWSRSADNVGCVLTRGLPG